MVIEQAERLAEAPTRGSMTGSAGLVTEAVYGARLAPRGNCDAVHPTAALASVDLRFAPGSTVLVDATTRQRLISTCDGLLPRSPRRPLQSSLGASKRGFTFLWTVNQSCHGTSSSWVPATSLPARREVL